MCRSDESSPGKLEREIRLNRSDFIEIVAEKAELTRDAAARAVDAIFDSASGAIFEAVHAAGSLSIPGFGKFTRRTRAARTGRNPRTGTSIDISERTSISFSAGKGLKEKLDTSRRKSSARLGGTSTERPAKGAEAKSGVKGSAGKAKSGKGSAAKSGGAGSSRTASFRAKAAARATRAKSAGGSKSGKGATTSTGPKRR
jgi:DNA-binding protein HU-beta